MAVKTTKDLRQILFETIEALRAKKIDPKEAREISGLAGRIIETADLEISFAKASSELDLQGQDINVGHILLTDK